MDKEVLNKHLEELKRDMKKDGIDEDSPLGMQLVRLTRETVTQHYEIKELKKEIAELKKAAQRGNRIYCELLKTLYLNGKISLNKAREIYGLSPISDPAADQEMILE